MLNAKSKIFIETPLLFSSKLSKLTGEQVYLKLENTQPSGSFKYRGNSYQSQKEVERGCKTLISASGGNAGLAVARVGKILQVPVKVFIPTTTPTSVIDLLEELGAEVIVHGKNFGEVNERALEEAKKAGHSYIHPYLHPETWEGHSSMVDEVKKQLGDVTPGCFIVSVGGGGLLKGVLTGMVRHGWSKVPVVGVETEGADCMARALAAGKPVDMDITSIACLGAKTFMSQLFDELPKYNIVNKVVTDKQAVQSVIRFADDHRMFVEPACGAPLTVLYNNMLKELIPQGIYGPVVLIVCGGSGVNFSLLQKWAEMFGLDIPYKEK